MFFNPKKSLTDLEDDLTLCNAALDWCQAAEESAKAIKKGATELGLPRTKVVDFEVWLIDTESVFEKQKRLIKREIAKREGERLNVVSLQQS